MREHSKHHDEKVVIKALVATAIILVLGFLLFYFFFNKLVKGEPESEVRQYNGFDFVNVGSAWLTQWERDGVTYNLEFRHPPWEVENITVRGKVDARFQMPYLFITHDPAPETSRGTAFVALAAADLTMMLRGVFEREGVAAACTANMTEACAQRPVVTCSANASVIYLQASNETGIFLDGNCATIMGYEESMTKAADKAIYQWLGIIR